MLGASPQGAESHNKFALKHQLGFPLLVDQGLELAARFGAVAGTPLKLKRSTFVIGPDGTIEHAYYGVKAAGHVDAVLAALKA